MNGMRCMKPNIIAAIPVRSFVGLEVSRNGNLTGCRHFGAHFAAIRLERSDDPISDLTGNVPAREEVEVPILPLYQMFLRN